MGGEESVVFARKLFDQHLCLVELLEIVAGHGIDAETLGAVDVVLITQDAQAHARAWDGGQADCFGVATIVSISTRELS